MPQQVIGLGTAPNDATGDTLRDGGDKINDNFTELYAAALKGVDWLYSIERSLVYGFIDTGTGWARSVGDVWTGTGSAQAAYKGDANTLQGRELRTSATLNNVYTLDDGAGADATDNCHFFLKHRIQCVWMGRLFSTNGFYRIWLVFTSDTAGSFTTGGGSDDPTTKTFVGFRATAGTGIWYACSGNGSNTTLVSTGVAVSTTQTQTFRIEWDRNGSSVRYYIDDALVATISTTLPASATAMRNLTTITNLTSDAAIRSLLISSIKIREGIITPVV